MLSDTVHQLTHVDFQDIVRVTEWWQEHATSPIGPHWSPAQMLEELAIVDGLVLKNDAMHLTAFILTRDLGVALEVSFLATAPEARGCGRMRSLLTTLVHRLPQGKAIWLEVHEQNIVASHLYAACGFRKVGRRANYYADGGAAVLFNYESAAPNGT